MARDAEQSILESRYTEILKSRDMEFQALVSDIASQTEMHKRLLNNKIAETT